MLVYHVTPTANLDSIQREGLQPRIGMLAKSAGETQAKIYVFASPADMENAVSNWLGDAFDEEPLSALVLDIPSESIEMPPNSYEMYLHEAIPPHCIVRTIDLDAPPETLQPLHLHNALQTFVWGNYRPQGAQGRLIMALALWRWSDEQLAVYSFNPQKNVPPYYYAATLDDRFEARIINIDGWHLKEKGSRAAREKDGMLFSSYSYGALDNPNALLEEQSTSIKKKIHELETHLRNKLGSLKWSEWKTHWDNAIPLSQSPLDNTYLTTPVRIGNRWCLPKKIPLHSPYSTWPADANADELVSWLSTISKNQIKWSYSFLDFQENLIGYLEHHPTCVWTSRHTNALIDQWQRIQKDGIPLDIHNSRHVWPIDATYVVHPVLHDVLKYLVEMHKEGGTDYHWLHATYGDGQNYAMYETTFQGKQVVTDNDTLNFHGVMFQLSAKRGEEGTLLMWDAHDQNESTQLDALRQIRAYCGGVVGIHDDVQKTNPPFWHARFQRKEIAQCGSETHWHWRMPKINYEPTALQHSHRHQDAQSVEYGLFQQAGYSNYWGSSKHSPTNEQTQQILNQPWGWKYLNEHPGALESLAIEDWARGYLIDTLWSTWSENLTPLETFSLATHLSPSISEYTLKKSLPRFLTPTQLAICEIGGFSTDVMLSVLREHGLAEAGIIRLDAPQVELPKMND